MPKVRSDLEAELLQQITLAVHNGGLLMQRAVLCLERFHLQASPSHMHDVNIHVGRTCQVTS